MKTLKKIGLYFLQIAEVLILDVGMLIMAIFAPKHIGATLVEGVEQAKAKKSRKKK